MTPRDLALGGLGILSLALLAVIGVEATSKPTPPTPDSAPVRVSDLPAAVVDDGSALVPIILARPLFALDRRPKAGPAATGAPSDDMPRLAGILIDPTQRRAIFQPNGDGKPLTVDEGDQVAGWQVQRIAIDGVTLTGPKGTQTLQPKPDPALAAAAPATPATAMPGLNPAPQNPRQFIPGGMQLPPGVPNPFAGQTVPKPGRPVAPQPPIRQPGGAPAAPNRR
ncbi:MAG TPA: hypothetical protein VGV37_03305 [Aliidongia sp.]|uniref:hypothetical protein n=1 Tax=Aliidongia sp. TaxID=1914230 RepID=UPI002DDD61B5|nr:hypothetical protein [Aliidongia sp.]HEV2673542.1 hypothetical protein [Aliidongia sp.]